jgi:hypothetical protein
LSIALAAGLMAVLHSPIVGMSAGIIAGRTILTFGYPWLIGRALNRPLRVQLRGVPRPAFTTVLLFGIAMWFGSRVTAHSCAMLAFLAGLTAVGAALLASIAGMTSNQRKAIRKRARKILREPRGRDRSAQNGDGR